MRRKPMMLAALCSAIVLSGCGGDSDPRLLNVKSDLVGPDEFAIVPNKPLTLPDDVSTLPEPGGRNRTEATPEEDAILALGGNPAGGLQDGGLVGYAQRYGVTPSIRSQLAQEDLEFRRKNDGRLLERLFNVNVYFKAYREHQLDQYAELERLRRLGVRTPSVPPEGFE